jgi:hypothetical protein
VELPDSSKASLLEWLLAVPALLAVLESLL